MTDAPRFLLDANVFIEAARRYYAFDLLPQFWNALIEEAKDHRVSSIDRVKKEIQRGKDQLAEWAKNEFDFAFAPSDQPDVIDRFGFLMDWVNSQAQFNGAAKEEFARVADGWLVAYAEVNGLTLVTHEQYEPKSKKRVPIPNVCRVVDVPCVDTFQMLRALEIRLA